MTNLSIIGATLAIATGSAQACEKPFDVDLSDHVTNVCDYGGARPPMILVHALGVDHNMWNESAKLLSENFRVISYDLRGHGRARKAPGQFSMTLFASDLAALMAKLSISKAHIVGLSMGGAIAQEFAISYPEKVDSLGLVATASKGQPAFAARGLSGKQDGMPAQVVPTLTRWFSPAALAVNGAGVRYAREMILANDVDDWQRSWNALATMTNFGRLGQIKAPTFVVAGENDASVGPALHYTDIVSQIPGARFAIVPGATHMVSLDKPVELANLLRANIGPR